MLVIRRLFGTGTICIAPSGLPLLLCLFPGLAPWAFLSRPCGASFAPETSVVRQKSFNIILPRSDRMGQEGGAEGIAKLRSGFWKAFRARPITIKTRGTIAQWRLLWHLASSRPKDTKRRGNRRSWAQRWGEYFP